MGETTKPMTWPCLHCGVESPIGESHSGQFGCISALRVRLSAAERERDEAVAEKDVYYRDLIAAGELRVSEQEAAFARGVEAAAKVAHAWGMTCSRAPLPETLESGLSAVAAFDVERRIRALAPAPDALEPWIVEQFTAPPHRPGGVTERGRQAIDRSVRRAAEDAAALSPATDAKKEPAEEWGDRDDEWTERIKAAFPTRSGSHKEYGIAMRMVGNRHGKFALVALVNWLLVEGKKATT